MEVLFYEHWIKNAPHLEAHQIRDRMAEEMDPVEKERGSYYVVVDAQGDDTEGKVGISLWKARVKIDDVLW